MTNEPLQPPSLKARVAFLLDEQNAKNTKAALMVTGTIVVLIILSAIQVVL